MAATGKQSSRWGSFLQQAVAGIESNLDNILSGDDVPQPKPAESPVILPKVDNVTPRSLSANPSTNDRLQERLARAVAAKKHASQKNGAQTPTSNVPSRVGSPVTLLESPRQSMDTITRGSGEAAQKVQTVSTVDEAVIPQVNIEGPDSMHTSPEAKVEPPATGLKTNNKTDTTVRLSFDSVSSAPARPSTDSFQYATDYEPAPEETTTLNLVAGEAGKREQRILADADREEEIHGYIERIDALQAKLEYLAKESAESARKAAIDAPSGSFEKKLAEKDEQIALLMDEGQKLSKTELKHMTVIKKLRARASESEKEATEVNKRLEKAEMEKTKMNERLKRADAAERQSNERQKQLSQVHKEMVMVKAERNSKDVLIGQLKTQLSDSVSQAKADEVKNVQSLLDTEKRRVGELEEEISSTKIGKDLAEERSRGQVKELQAKAERETERARVAELELKGEIQMLESRLEVMRARAEEVSSGATGDAQAKFLRQIETLQTQYAVASENWKGIETSLTSRVTSLQKERDEVLHRESDIRKKTREMTLRAKSNEDEVEILLAKIGDLQQEVTLQKTQVEKLQRRADETQSALRDAKNSFEQEKLGWTSELQQRIEEERNKWREEPTRSPFGYDRAISPVASSGRGLTAEFLGLQNLQTRRVSSRGILDDLPRVEHPMSRRSSTRIPQSSGHVTPKRQDSSTLFSPSGDVPDAPFITMDHDDYFDNTAPPSEHHQNPNDILSVSTVGAGPSVQLVERMSAAVRRLENEKVSTREDMARLAKQRDEARAEILSLMQEVEAKKSDHSRVLELEKQVEEINARYQTTLEMLGEKSEMVEELKADVQDVKAMYRDLVERTVE